MNFRFASFLRLCLLTVILAGAAFRPQFGVSAAANMTVTPITWNVVGLDSNNVSVGPNNFPVGARVCNTSTAGETLTNVTADFVWDNANAYIDLRALSQDPITVASLAPGACTDFYFEVTVTRNAAAYDQTRDYRINVTSTETGATIFSTPIPREIYVERLVSQNRNSVTDVRLNGVSVAAGGTMNLMVGSTYTIQLVGSTATQGYEQIESFINFPNTIFRVNSVTATYTANDGTDPLALSKLYADGCGWVNDPNDVTTPAYRECTGTGKYGGNITITYNVTIIGGGGTNQTLNTLIYDFSGSSYHYNSDFSSSSRVASITDPSLCTQFTIAAWNFENPDGTSTTASTDNAVGTPTITPVTLSVPGTVAGNGGGSAREHSAWNTTGTLDTAADYLQFAASTVGYYNIQFSYDLYRSNQGPSSIVAAYDTDGAGAPTTLAVDTLAGTTWTSFSKNLSAVSTMNDIPGARFLLYGYNATNAGGTLRTDNFTIAGCKLPAGLNLAKSGSPASFTAAGQTITYTYILTNSGQVAVQSPYILTDSKGAAMTISCAGATSPLAPGASTTCTGTYVTTAADVTAGFVTNTATVSTTTVIGDAITSNQATETVELAAFSAAKQVSTSATGPWSENVTVNFGDTVYFQITVDNTGTANLTGVTVDDGMVACTLTGPTGDTDTDNALDADETWVYTCSITASAGTNIINTATVDSNETAPVTDTASYTGQQADLTVTKANNVSGSVPLNGTFDWTITVTNNGTGNATFTDGQTILSDTLPGGATYNPVVILGGAIFMGPIDCSITSGVLACTANGGPVTIPSGASFTATVNVTATSAGALVNTVTVDPNGNVTESNEGNNTGSDTVTVTPVANLQVTKTDGTASVNAGGTTTYTLRVTNNGPSNVTGAVVSDPAVAGLSKTAVACSGTPGQCVTPPTVAQLEGGTFALPALASGQFYEITVTATVTATSGSVTNTVTVAPPAGTTDPDNTNNAVSDTDTVNPIADLVVTKTDGVVVVNTGGTTTYTLTLTNNGPSAADNAAVSDPAATGLTKTAIGTCTPASGAVCPTVGVGAGQMNITNLEAGTVVVPTLPNGGSISFTITADVTAVGGTVANIFSVTPPGGTTDPTPAAVTDTDAVNLLPNAVNDTASTNEGVAVITNVLTNDDQGDAPATVTSFTQGANGGTVSCTTGGACTYTPPVGFSGIDTYTYTITDSNGDTSTATVTVTVIDLPDAVDDSASTNEGTPVTTSVLTNDDLGTEPTAITSNTQGTNGTVSCTATQCTYTPNAGFTGTDTYTYTLTDDNGNTDTATVTVTVIDLPDAVDDSASTNEGTPVTTGVLTNDDLGTEPTTVTSNTQGTNGTVSCTATQCTYTPNAGFTGTDTYTYTLTDDNGNTDTATVTVTVVLVSNPALNVVKEISTSANGPWNDTSVSVTVGDTVYYRIRVANTGNVPLTGLTVDDSMAACTLTRGADITGDNDNNFEVGEEWAYTCSVTAVLGTVNNIATADTNETLADTDTASYTASAALVADPAISKVGNPLQASVGETVTFTLTVTNAGNAPAPNVVITDALPAIFDVTAVNVSGAPLGTLVNVTPPIGVGPAPYTVVVTLGGNLGVTDVVTINIVTTVNAQGNPPINNTASLTTTSQTDLVANNSAGVALTIQPASEVAARVKKLPATGFAPNVVTVVSPQPQELKYAATDVVLEIPSLGVKIPIVGVPIKNGEWNVSWLGKQAGWLEGSAFPSWSGNSVLTSHVYLSNGLPGPFVNLNKLKYGDKIVVHAYGQKYTFEVRANTVVEPNDVSIFKHEELTWLTLVTCKEYDEKTNTYKKRVVIRAVLVSVARE